MARPNKIVLVITGDPTDNVRQRRGDYAAIIAEAVGGAHDGPYVAVDARTGPLPPLSADDVVIISGSSANVHQREPWMTTTEAWLREAVGRGTAALGLCFGHQLLAQALGGEVMPNPRGREIGTVTIERVADDPLFEGLEPRFAANACHVDTVSRLPSGAVVLARSERDPHQTLKFTPRCYGVQFHPEFDGEVIRGFIEARSDAMRSEGLDPDAAHAAAEDTPAARRLIENFLGLARR